MSFADGETDLAGKLIERLLVDATFRAEFRRDPVGTCEATGLATLAAELRGSGTGMQTLELRESRSSLAGVVMAVAAEGVGFAELKGLMGHGLNPAAHAAALKALKTGHIAPPHVKAPGLRSLEHQVQQAERSAARASHAPATPAVQPSPATPAAQAPAAQAPAQAPAAQPAPAGGAASAAPAGGAGAVAHTAGAAPAPTAAASAPAAATPAAAADAPPAATPATATGSGAVSTAAASSGAATAPAPAAGSGGAASTVPAGSGGAASTVPAGSGGAASTVPAGSGGAAQAAAPAGSGQGIVPSGGAAAGGASVTELLSSTQLSAPPAFRALLAGGGVDPRLVSVLSSAVSHHTVVLGQFESATVPVHAQGVDILAVDGQPVGPGNVGARDLLTEIAAMDPSVRPSEIGSPWPIQSPGFFSDSAHQDRLSLGFVSAGDYTPGSAAGVAGSAAGAPAAIPAAAPAPPVGPAAASPAAAGAAQAADAALAAPAQPPAAGVAAGTVPQGGATTPAAPGQQVVAAAGVVAAAAPATDPFFASPTAHNAFEFARHELGVPYLWGGTSPKTGFDCSGLMQWAYHQAGVDLPRVAADQFHVGTPVDLAHLREGDLVFFQDSTGYIHHVGMYVGNHQFLEAPHTGDVVRYADLRDSYWAQQFAGGRRVTPLADPPAAATPSAGAAPAANVVSGAGGAPAAAPAVTPAAAPAVTPAAATPQAAGAVPATGAATGGPPPPQPGTALFRALDRQERAFHRHTVQFMAAVKPPPVPTAAAPATAAAGASATAVPGAPAAAAGTPAAAGSAGGAAPVVIPAAEVAQTPGQATAPVAGGAQQPVAGIAQQPVAGSGSGAAPDLVGHSISVTSPLLTSGQQKFAGRLAELTGLDPRVISAWELAEESGGAAGAREASSNFNWLNIGYFDSGAGAIAFDKAFGDPVSAAEQTANFLQGKWGGASSGIREILNTVGQPPHAQMMAIANSGWASSRYGNGANLIATYDELANMSVTRV